MRRTPRPFVALALGAAAVLALASCQRADDKAFGERVHAYLLNHPEVIQEAAQRLQDKQFAAQTAQIAANVPKYRAALERDPADFVANPTGKVTVTQFYDYRCPHCVNIAPSIVALIRNNPDVRVVFKETPIFGPLSEHAANDAYIVKAAGGDYVGFYDQAMAGGARSEEQVDRIALAHGASAAQLKDPALIAASVKHIAENHALFGALGFTGTPGYVIGDSVVPGESMEMIDAALTKARGGPPAP
jgi:protein-disulfide isomerase